MPLITTDAALDGDRDMDPEDGTAWMDEAAVPHERYIISTTTKYTVDAANAEHALYLFNEEEAEFLEETAPLIERAGDFD